MGKKKAKTRSARRISRQHRKGRIRKRHDSGSSWWIIGLVAIAVLLGGGLLVAASRTGGVKGAYYPPTDIRGHTENVPPSHILSSPMPLSVHKHMLEHADGSGPPGVIINYNCEDFECAPDLVDRLAAIVNDYPDNVYLAPFPNMSAKIVVSRYQRRLVLDEYDEEKIREFIERG